MTKRNRQKELKKYENNMEQLRAKAPNSIPYEDCWNLKDKLAGIIADHLRAFIFWEKHGPDGGIPGAIAEKYSDHDKGMREWLGILKKMLFAFESFRDYEYLPACPEGVDYEEHVRQFEEGKARVREGMQLFIDYWNYLWI